MAHPPAAPSTARESAALADGASISAAEPTAARSRSPCSGSRRHARMPHIHCLLCTRLRLSSRLPGRVRPGSPLHILSGHTLPHWTRAILYFPENRPGGHDLLCRWSAHRFPCHTKWAAFLSQSTRFVGLDEILDLPPRDRSRRIPSEVHPSRGHRQLSEGFSTHQGRIGPPEGVQGRPRASGQLSSCPWPKST